MADYTYSTVPRRCGGSHTLTYPYRRTRLQHLSQGLYPHEEIQIAMKVGVLPAGRKAGRALTRPRVLQPLRKSHPRAPDPTLCPGQCLYRTQ